MAMTGYHMHNAKEFQLWPSALSFEKNYTLKCFNCSLEEINCSFNNHSFEGTICALHSIPSAKEGEKEHIQAHFRNLVRLYHS